VISNKRREKKKKEGNKQKQEGKKKSETPFSLNRTNTLFNEGRIG